MSKLIRSHSNRISKLIQTLKSGRVFRLRKPLPGALEVFEQFGISAEDVAKYQLLPPEGETTEQRKQMRARERYAKQRGLAGGSYKRRELKNGINTATIISRTIEQIVSIEELSNVEAIKMEKDS